MRRRNRGGEAPLEGPVRLGLVGCGRVAERLYRPAFAAAPSVVLTAVADPSPERRAILAGLTRARGHPDLASMLGRSDLEGVVVTAPLELHEALVVEAVEAGLPVLVEKPLAPTAEAVARIARVVAGPAEPAGLEEARATSSVMVGFNRRRLPAVIRLREELARRAGPLEFVSEFHALPELWAPVSEVPPVLDDLATHHLDLLLHLAGTAARSIRATPRGRAAFTLEVELDDGSRGRIDVSQGRQSRERVTVSRDGSRWEIRPGSDRLEPAGGVLRTALDRAEKVRRRLSGRPSPMIRSFAAQLHAFGSGIRTGTPMTPGVQDGVAVAYLVDAARHSAAAGGEPVTLGGP